MQLLEHIHAHKFKVHARVSEHGRHEKIGACYEELSVHNFHVHLHIA